MFYIYNILNRPARDKTAVIMVIWKGVGWITQPLVILLFKLYINSYEC